jgi:hypothetical protein
MRASMVRRVTVSVLIAACVSVAFPGVARADIDPYGSDPNVLSGTRSAICQGQRSGTEELKAFFDGQWPSLSSVQTYYCREINSTSSSNPDCDGEVSPPSSTCWSTHAAGRALDLMVGSNTALGNEIVNWLLATRNGYPHYYARVMGVQQVLWNNDCWDAQVTGDRSVTSVSAMRSCSSGHLDHPHVTLSDAGSFGQTSWFGSPTPPSSSESMLRADYDGDGVPDLWVIKRLGGDNKTQFHIVDGSNPGAYLANTTTIQGATTVNASGTNVPLYDFDVADYNGDGTPDLWVIKRRGNDNKTQFHIVDGANPGVYLANTTTVQGDTTAAVPNTDTPLYEFEVADYDGDGTPDLWVIKRKGGDGNTQFHIVDGANPSEYLANTTTVQGNTEPYAAGTDVPLYDFDVDDYNGDDRPDLWVIKRRGNDNKTQFHIVDGANPSEYLANTTTIQGDTTGEASGVNIPLYDFKVEDYDGDGTPDLWVLKRKGGDGKTQFHIVDGSNPSDYLANTTTVQGSTTALVTNTDTPLYELS